MASMGPLRTAVGGDHRRAFPAHAAGDVDDRTAAAGRHGDSDAPAEEQRREHVDGVEILEGGAVDRPGRADVIDPGVVDEHVDVGGGLGERLDLDRVREVGDVDLGVRQAVRDGAQGALVAAGDEGGRVGQ